MNKKPEEQQTSEIGVTPVRTRIELKEDQPLKDVIPPSCEGYFRFGARGGKTKKSNECKIPKSFEKPLPKIEEEVPEPPRCQSCGKLLYSHEHEMCETCKSRNNRRYFKGVPGLQDLPLEKIAMLPAGARDMYLKHMDCAEADQLNALIRRNK